MPWHRCGHRGHNPAKRAVFKSQTSPGHALGQRPSECMWCLGFPRSIVDSRKHIFSLVLYNLGKHFSMWLSDLNKDKSNGNKNPGACMKAGVWKMRIIARVHWGPIRPWSWCSQRPREIDWSGHRLQGLRSLSQQSIKHNVVQVQHINITKIWKSSLFLVSMRKIVKYGQLPENKQQNITHGQQNSFKKNTCPQTVSDGADLLLKWILYSLKAKLTVTFQFSLWTTKKC